MIKSKAVNPSSSNKQAVRKQVPESDENFKKGSQFEKIHCQNEGLNPYEAQVKKESPKNKSIPMGASGMERLLESPY